jgi:hypothetical protein
MVPAVAVKVTVVAATGMVTDADTGSRVLLLESETVVPPVGAAELRVTVQVLAAPEARVVGLQASEERLTGAVRLMAAVLDTPLRVAVRVALCVLGMVPAVAVKMTVVEAAGTLTEAATGSRVLLLESETLVPPVGAAELRVTVQVVPPKLVIVDGAQDNELRDGAAAPPVTVPPVAERAIALPAPEDATALVIPIDVLVAPVAIVRFTTATMPFEIMLVFMP